MPCSTVIPGEPFDLDNITEGTVNKHFTAAHLTTLQNAAALPVQTGNDGKFLQTNGTVASWGTPAGGGAVDSVNGETGAVTLTTDDISDASQTNKWATAAEKTKLGNISVTQAVDLDTMESSLAGKLDATAAKGYTINVQALTSSPADGQTIYFGRLPKAPVTTAGASKVYIRKAGTITMADIYCYSGTAGTSEAWSLYIRKNNTTDTLIATVSAATNERVFTNSSLSIAVSAGDYIEIKGVNPTWATNPLTTIFGGYIYIE